MSFADRGVGAPVAGSQLERCGAARPRRLMIVTAFAFAAAVVGCASGTASSGAQSGGLSSFARKEALAPIDGAEILVRESFPPQYAVRIVSGLPSGCASFERIDVERARSTFALTVWNTVPADDRVACTMIYGTAENTVTLPGDFESGEGYVVTVNGERRLAFTAQ